MNDSVTTLPESMATPIEKTEAAPAATSRKLGQLRMIARFASHYPRQIFYAAIALAVAAAATLAIPAGFQRIIDNGFIEGGGDIDPYFRYLLMIVGVLAISTAGAFSISLAGSASGWLPISAWRCRKTCFASPRASSRKTARPR